MKHLKTFNESQQQTVNLEDLVGEHMLSGVEISTEPGHDTSQYNAIVVKFVLDGITYKAVEDPSDGYRSYCRDIVICKDKILNMFPKHKVIGKMNTDKKTNHIIEFYDAATKGVVLEIGTSYTDYYYPYSVIHWTPENLELNQSVNKYNL